MTQTNPYPIRLYRREPSPQLISEWGGGFESNFAVLNAIWTQHGFPTERVYGIEADMLNPKLHGKFDAIFSHSVLEHIPNIDVVLDKISSVMANNGVQAHFVPNYIFPYEPHYETICLPRLEWVTAILKGIQDQPMWRSLNFISFFSFRRAAKRQSLSLKLTENLLLRSFKRLDEDELYRQRQRLLVPVWQFLKISGLRIVLEYLPLWMTTPIVAVLEKE